MARPRTQYSAPGVRLGDAAHAVLRIDPVPASDLDRRAVAAVLERRRDADLAQQVELKAAQRLLAARTVQRQIAQHPRVGKNSSSCGSPRASRRTSSSFR
jgi:hypothetical protein